MSGLTRDEARDRVAQIIAAQRYHYGSVAYDRDADAALSVLWPEVERLTRERDEARRALLLEPSGSDAAADARDSKYVERRVLNESIALSGALLRGYREAHDDLGAEVERLRAELAHAHAVIARHVEPKRSTGSWDHKWPGGEDGNTPSDALYGDLTASKPRGGCSRARRQNGARLMDDLCWAVVTDSRDQRAMWRDLRRVLTDDEWSRYVGQSVTRRGVIWTHEHLVLPNRARRYT